MIYLTIFENHQPVFFKLLKTTLIKIKSNYFKNKLKNLQKYWEDNDEVSYQYEKAGLRTFSPYGIFEKRDGHLNLKIYSHLVLLDFPDIPKKQWGKTRAKACKSKYTLACFLGFDAKSLIVLVRTNAPQKFHYLAFDKTKTHYERLLHATSHPKTARLDYECLFSHDKQIYINFDAETFPALDPNSRYAIKGASKEKLPIVRNQRNAIKYIRMLHGYHLF